MPLERILSERELRRALLERFRPPRGRRGGVAAGKVHRMSGSPEELCRLAYARYSAGEIEAMLELFHPDVEVYVAPPNFESGTYRGHDEYRELLERWAIVVGRDAHGADRAERQRELGARRSSSTSGSARARPSRSPSARASSRTGRRGAACATRSTGTRPTAGPPSPGTRRNQPSSECRAPALGLVLLAAGAHALWNLLAKTAPGGGAAFVWLASIFGAGVLTPPALVLVATSPPSPAAVSVHGRHRA